MSDISTLTLEQAQDKLAAKQKELRTGLKEAETDSGTYDHSKVKAFGANIKSSSDLIEEVKQRNDELNAIGEHIEGLLELKGASENLDRMEKGRRGFPLPGAGGGAGGFGGGSPANRGQFKSLGQLATEEKGFKDWQGAGAGGGINLKFDDVDPSTYLAKAANFDTMSSKALMATTAGYAPESIRAPGFVEAATRPIQLLDILPVARISQEADKYMEETTRTHAAAETAEGATFAESEFVFTERTNPVQKITDSVPVTDEQLEDAAMIESYINGRLAFGVRQRLDRQCMIGDGTGSNLTGILNTTGIQTAARGADTAMDAIYKAITNVSLIGRAMATHINQHPLDWQDIRLQKTSDGLYLYGSPADAGPERLWGLPVVKNDAMAQGTSLVGSFQPAWITLFERRGIDIQVGFVGTQFAQGRRTVRADMRAVLRVARPAAFHAVTGLNA